MSKDLILLIKKISLFALPPVLALVLLYIYLDPFKIVHDYRNFYDPAQFHPVEYNRDYIATETLVKNGPSNYDSYIFGNSTGMVYKMDDWKQYIHAAGCYHFEAWDDLLSGIILKLKFLEKQHSPVKNALIIGNRAMISDITFATSPIYYKAPRLLPHSELKFQLAFFNMFTDYKFLVSYMDFLLTKKTNRFYTVLETDTLDYNLNYNEVERISAENRIKRDKRKYYTSHQSWWEHDSTAGTIARSTVGPQQRAEWTEIHDMLQKDSADVKIIIGPDYDQIYVNESDLAFLQSLFGKDHVFDFTGKNSITNNKDNYYDPDHYRPPVASFILHQIYNPRDSLFHK